MTVVRPAAHSFFRRRPLTALSAALIGAFLSTSAQAADGFTFPGTFGGTSSSANGVSADGAVVVGWAHTSDAYGKAFRWTSGGGMINLGTLGGGNDSRANGVSADGSVVVGQAHTGYVWHAFRWTQASGIISLGTLGGSHSFANGVSADGLVVVGEANTTGDASTHAFRWMGDGGMTDLGTLGGTNSRAYGISADGAVVVGRARITNDAAFHAFRWVNGAAGGVTGNPQMYDLSTLGGTNSEAFGVSADGAVVVG